MLRMFLLVFIGLLQRSYGDLPSLCSDGYLEVINGTETRFICSNVLGAQTIRWYFKGNTMATCRPLLYPIEQMCVVTYLPVVFTVSRTSPTTSVVTVKPIFKDKQSNLSCEITETKAISNCPVDLTYSATVSSCTVEFSGSTWTVSSQCNITKVYSSLDRYRCDLYQRIQNDPEERRVDSSTMSTSRITEADYFSGYCSMTSFLPSEGTYSYRVMLIPGYVNVTPPFIGNNFIRIPKGYLSHNCPTSVSEYGNLQCVCSVTDRGSPQGEIRWKNSSTNELSLNGVLRAQNGNILTCVLTWNRTEIQFLHYTIIVTYPPSDIQFKVNNIETVNATVKENSTVRMLCLADGRPTPSMRLISINKNTVLNTSPRGNVTVNDIRATVTYDMESVQCQDTGEYECEVDIGPGQTHKRISLFVMCAPRQTTQDIYSGTFNGGEARLEFKIIAYPPPDEMSVYYISPSLNDTTLRKMEYKNTVRFVCTYDNLVRYMVTCTVTLFNETIFSTGVYHAVFSNALGNISLTFEIKEHVDTPEQSTAEVAGPVAGGVIGAVIVIALVVSVVIFIIRRKRSGFDGGTGTNPAMTSKTDPQRIVTVSLCKDSKYLEVKEGRDDNRFVCTGLTAQQTVSWFWGTTFILKCTSSSCDINYFSAYFKISRSLPTESDITVNATALSDLGSSALANLTCHVSGDNKDTCQLDVVYPAENPQCQIQFSGDTWEVISRCTVSKVRSRRDRYGCYLYQISEHLTALFLGTFTTSLKPSSEANYFSGECQIKITLPSEGKYNYSVIIIPGEVQVFPSFNGSNAIRRPSESPQHNCPQYVTESGDINCLCYSDNLGLPSGFLIWRGANSPKLTLNQVNRTYSGTSNTCILMWNNTAVQSTQYTVTVNYPSRVLSFKIDNKADDIVTVKENTNVSVVCQAEGRQLPTIHLFKGSSDNQDLELASTNNTLELQYTMTAVKCETTATYSCKAENNIAGDQKYIQLIVSCAPRQTMHDSYSVTFNGDEARLHFKFLADPAPNVLSIFSIKSSLNDTTSRKVEYQNSVEFDCKSDQLYRYMVTCTVSLLNKTAFRPRVYDAVFSNDLGNISLTFEIKEQVDSTGQSKSEIAGPVAGGVIGAFVVIMVVVSTVIFIRRKRRKPHERGLQTNQVLTPKTSERNLETLYDHLQRGDINSPSVYQTLEPLQAPEHKDQGKSHEAAIDLHENTRGTRHKEIIYQNTTFS